MTRMTQNGRIKGFLTRPFCVIRVIRGYDLVFSQIIASSQNNSLRRKREKDNGEASTV